ncbi:DNA RNA helicase domain containing protein [Aphelenchoides besseyi]|nr:DNA RNA helicase domain containing protein [Aphelenchoides besseyi]
MIMENGNSHVRLEDSDSDIIDFDGEITSDSESSSQENDQNAHQTEANGHISEELNESDVESVATTASANFNAKEEQNVEDEKMDVDEEETRSFKVLGVQEFVEKKNLLSIPEWAAKPITFSAKIDSRTGDGISVFKGLDQGLFESLSKELSVWFPVQLAVLPLLLNPPTLLPPRDVAISAPTGSGKTLCYLIPVLNHLCVQPVDHLSALIVAPTRSLVQQIAAEFAKYNVSKAQIVVLNEFLSYEQERRVLFPDGSKKSNVNVIISTPQRLVEHLIDGTKQIDLTKLRYLVVDEADSLKFVREEWLELVERLANYQCLHTMSYGSLVAHDKNTRLQKILVSATLSLEADKLHIWSLRCPRLFRANVSSVIEKRNAIEDEEKMEMDNKKDVRPINDSDRLTLPEGMRHEVVSKRRKICQAEYKPLFVYSYLAKNPNWRRSLIFVNNLTDSRRLFILLKHLLEKERQILEFSTNTYGTRRLKILKKLKNQEDYIAICTDSVGRGIDFSVAAVFNYNLPRDAQTFVHRAGRTARAGQNGTVISLATKEEKLLFKKNLMSVGVYDSVVENRERETAFVEEYREKYQQALTALKKELETVRQSVRRK